MKSDLPPLLVPLFDVRLDEADMRAAMAPLQDGWLTLGPRTAQFEEAFASALGARHVVAVSSGTAALHLALAGLGIGPGDEVICPALTFVATVAAVRHVGATPVLCDIVGPDDLNLDPEDVAARITPRTRAVLAVHYAGYPADLPRLAALCEQHGLLLVEDSAHSLISHKDGRACGTWGAAGCFSFFTNKNMTCGEGGAIATDDDLFASRARLLRSHGMTSSTLERHHSLADSYDVVGLGFNYRIDEVRSSLLLAQLARLDGFLAQRDTRVARYRDRLWGSSVGVPDFGLAEEAPGDRVAHHIFPIVLPAGTRRSQVRARLRMAGIQTSIHYPPIHRLTAHADLGPQELPQLDAVAERLLTLPLFPGLTDEQVDLVCGELDAALALERAS